MPGIRRILLAALLLAASTARAQVDCDTPDDLCVGDPCVVGTVAVDETCVLDFGARTLVVAGRLAMPNGGELALAAGSIRIEGTVENLRPVGPPSTGPRMSFTADGDIAFDGRIRLSDARGAELAGEVVLDAGGSLEVDGSLKASTAPTTVLYRAGGGDLSFTGRVYQSGDGGSLTLSASGELGLDGSLSQIEHVAVAAGSHVDVRGRMSPPLTLTVDAGGVLTFATTIRSYGADLALRGDLGVLVERSIILTPVFVFAGSLEIASANGAVTIEKEIRSVEIRVTAADDLVANALVSARPPTRSGGTIELTSTGGDVLVREALRAQSGDGAQPDDGAGGHVRITAAGLASIGSNVQVSAFPGRQDAPGGTVEIEAGRILTAGGLFDADGGTPSPVFAGSPPAGFRFTSTAGEIVLDGTFHARGGPSVIAATSAAELVAAGQFEAAPDGCIGLAAAGTLDTSAATFDTPVVASCP
jgi:hypothetical protein